MYNEEEFGEPYDYMDTPRFWAEQEMERRLVENYNERNERNGD